MQLSQDKPKGYKGKHAEGKHREGTVYKSGSDSSSGTVYRAKGKRVTPMDTDNTSPRDSRLRKK